MKARSNDVLLRAVRSRLREHTGPRAVQQLPGIQEQEVESLRRAGIETVDELWASAGEAGIDRLATQVGLPAERLLDLLATQALHEDEGKTGSWLQRTWPRLKDNWLVAAICWLIALLVWLALCMPEPSGTVVNVRQLPALHLIEEGDVERREGGAEPGSFTEIQEVLGRYTVQAIPPETALRGGQVTRFRASEIDPGMMDGRRIVSIPIAVEAPDRADLGDWVSLLFAPRDDAPPEASSKAFLLKDAIVLATNRGDEGMHIVVAVKETDLETLGHFVSRSDVFIVQPGP